MPTLASLEGGRSPPSRPTTTATALTSIATGLTPGEHGLIGYRIVVGGEVLNVLRWTRRRRRSPPGAPAARAAAVRRRSSGHAVPVVSRRARADRRSPRPTCAASRPVGWRAASAIAGRDRPPAARAGEPSSTPTTTASTRSPTSAASASSTRPSCASPTVSSADVLERPARRRGAARHRRPRPGRGRRPHRACPTPDLLAHVAAAVGRGSVPLAARHARRGRRPAGQAATDALRRRRLGGHPGADDRRGLVRPDVSPRRSRRASATSRSSPTTRSASSTRRHRPVRAGVPARLGDVGRGVRAAARGRPHDDDEEPTMPDDRPTVSDAPADDRARRDELVAARARTPPDGATHRARDRSTSPAKVMRIGSMVKQLLEEVRAAPLDEPSRERLARDLRALDRRAVRGAVARPAGGAAIAGPAVQRRRRPDRSRAAHRQGAARRLARGPVPRHPGDAVRPAAGRPPAARADAPAAAGRRRARHARPAGPAGPAARPARTGPPRHVPLTPL